MQFKMERRIVPTFEEYVAHLDETLRNDPLMKLARVPQNKHLYPENNTGILSEVEINVVDKILRADGFVQMEEDYVWDAPDFPHRLRRVFDNPNNPNTMSVQLFIPTKSHTQEIYYTEPETHFWNYIGPGNRKKVGELNVRAEYTFHPHGRGVGKAISQGEKHYSEWLEHYRRMELTKEQRETIEGTRIDPQNPHTNIIARTFTQEMANFLRQFSKVPGSSIFYMMNRPPIIAKNNLSLSY